LKDAINILQEDLNTQKIIAETVSEENRKLRLQIEDLKKRQSDLKEKLDKMTTMFQETFGRFGESLKRGQLTNLKKAKTEKKGSENQFKPVFTSSFSSSSDKIIFT
jgi:regulator of replication initiation timing